jgi:hypothetical protein
VFEAVFGEAKEVKEFTVPAPPKMEFKRSKMRRVSQKEWRVMDFCCGGECDEVKCKDEVLKCDEVKCEDEVSICPVGVGKEKLNMSMNFQVADVIKPLVSVRKLAEKGNRVCFGPDEEDNFIENKQTKKG